MSQAHKRRKTSADGTNDRVPAKRHEATLNSIGDEFVCPITRELPLVPVTAMDGRIYERSAIEEHIDRAQGEHALRSPATNEPMEPDLLDALQVRNTIDQLVQSGALRGDKARRWEERAKDEKHVASLKKEAEENGDPEAMYKLGHVYNNGRYGQKQDEARAMRWYKKAADRHYPPAMAYVGARLTSDSGAAQNIVEGAVLITSAAEGGSAMAAFLLGLWYDQGRHGMPKNSRKAKVWLQKAVSASGKFSFDISEMAEAAAMNLLNKLSGGSTVGAAEEQEHAVPS